ncbi:hypothetical protein [Metabacillus sp. FJAT-52054]|uniref:Uncharacterized protein n=1 Tax=Metabacillus sediminis TaxID=3117746 RepID=A0ABZ2NHF0_9BACI
MNYQLVCTTEELAILVSICGYPEFSNGIAVTSFGDRTEKDWNLVTQVTIPQLILKEIWDEQKEAAGLLPISETMHTFIQSYVESKRMIRCSDLPNKSAFMFHKATDNGWLAHIIYKDIIHEFFYVETEEIPKLIRDYYKFEFTSEFKNHEFNLSESDFDALSKQDHMNQILSNMDASESQSFEKFLADLKESDWSLFNISNFSLFEKQEDAYLENIVFFLPSTNGVWVAEYTDDAKTPVSIRLTPEDEWYQVVNGVGFVAAASS